MNLDAAAIEAEIKTRIMAIAEQLGDDASDLQPEEIIPATGLIDSAGLLELIAWFEATYDFSIPPADLTIDNLGSMRDMANYLRRRKGLN
ncbi:acyl carrier protein [Burkholderiales bacterium JOSHI_001]|nr:acyl carrier protein [Burkholderiales bacterium JOSHI_001]